MTRPFDLFVIFASMRTGSNLLETNLNAVEGIRCYGEAFNPYLIGYPNKEELLGVTQAERDADPLELLNRICSVPGTLGGFRFFPDHDPRILEAVLDNRRCAKVILTRNPLESYVSHKIAVETDQWKLTNVSRRREAKVKFDGPEFDEHRETLGRFHAHLKDQLQRTGQTAFHIDYDDLRSVEVLNGLARFLGVDGKMEGVDQTLKVQNPEPIVEKVSNKGEMADHLAKIDPFALARVPNFEPPRPASVSHYVAAAEAPLIYLPIRGGPEARVRNWLAALDGVDPGELQTELTQKTLRHWMRHHPGHRSFTVLRHPAMRAHDAFCRLLHGHGDPRLPAILARNHGLDLPEVPGAPGYDLATHRRAFLQFLDFLGANLSGQTALRVDAFWCSQSVALKGFGSFALPDIVIREAEMEEELDRLARKLGRSDVPVLEPEAPQSPFAFDSVYDSDIEARTVQVYRRDYLIFGFGPWVGASRSLI